MIAVIFEVLPAEGHYSRYLELAAELKPLLADIDGFISIERFQSLSEPGKILSLSFWCDEAAVLHWRNQELHRNVQHQGRDSVFNDYRLRVAGVIRDYGMFDREQAPLDSRDAHKESPHA
ncbi:antibiotic biosynthesis monooxygenase family protein [Cedecea sp. NFIX57]|uniref:antibiotic biosynthesis monooxygenase family protein n=1 Tax=Cedecea sp. NFIX57 TaxID=1566286 RepID=UPI000A0E8BD3|nr:antibiotic biosynthesis monooxygenase [Cedecea sp. NFIX57]SMG29336.1 Heme-degrading monooxygenase HmoA [Cedecea sp. NFIX57]